MHRLARHRAKRWLGLLLVLGVLLFSGTGGTFSSFNAETTNAGSGIASGTLTMTNQVSGQSACFSASAGVGTPAGNVNAHCSAILSLSNIEPSSWNPSTQEANVTITNSGTLNASNLTLFAPSATDCTDSQTTNGSAINFNAAPSVVTLTTAASGTVTSLSLSSIPEPITYGDSIVVTNSSGQSETFTASSTYTGASSTTSVSVSSQAATATFGVGSTVDDITQWPTYVATNKFPTVSTAIAYQAAVSSITVSSLPGAIDTGDLLAVTNASGQEQTFTVGASSYAAGSSSVAVSVISTTAGYAFPSGSTVEDLTSWRPFCSSTVLYVQEAATVSGSTDYYCWYGPGAAANGASESTTDGLCDTPLTLTGTAVTAGNNVTSLTFSDLPVQLTSGSYVSLTNSSGQGQSFPVATSVGPSTSQTSVAITSTAATYSFPIGSAGVDSSTQSLTLGTQTLSSFDASNAQNIGGISLYPINGAGTVSKSTTALSSGASRVFTVGLYLPTVSGHNQNVLQGLQSSFGMSWYMSQ